MARVRGTRHARCDVPQGMRDKSLSILVMNSRTNASRRVRFESVPVTIGRHDLSRLQLVDPGVSRFHAVIDWTEPQIVVCDLGSVNGTFFEGMPLRPCEPTTIDEEDFSIAVGPFHLAVSRHVPVPVHDPEATCVMDPSDLARLRRPGDGVTVIGSRTRR